MTWARNPVLNRGCRFHMKKFEMVFCRFKAHFKFFVASLVASQEETVDCLDRFSELLIMDLEKERSL